MHALNRLLTLAVVSTVLTFGACTTEQIPAPQTPRAPDFGHEWQNRGVLYELWVRSFQDSDGDGIGDINGLISRLDYLADLGISGIWLMPVYPSPLHDSGYDVADYVGIHPDYGTLEDFDRLLAEAHKRNIHIVMDLVFNHVSTEHAWFQDARASNDSPYRDWFVWADEPGTSCPDVAPSTFGTDRWTWDEQAGQYFFHQFLPTQADLNFRNPEVQEALLDTMRFWLDRGVDGFRLDVPHTYVEGDVLCWHQPETHDFIRRMRRVTDEYPGAFMVGETWGNAEEVASFYGDGSDELHMIFDFELTTAAWSLPAGGETVLDRYLRALAERVHLYPEGAQATMTLGNHDIARVSSSQRHIPERLKLLAALQLTLPGTPFLYYGEEIGLKPGTDINVDLRDGARAPMPWTAGPNAGFTTGSPWLELAGGYEDQNVAGQLAEPDSILHAYRSLIALRNRLPALQDPTLHRLDEFRVDDTTLSFRRGQGADAVTVVLHFGDQARTLPLPEEATGHVLWASGDVTEKDGVLTLPPFAAVVLAH